MGKWNVVCALLLIVLPLLTISVRAPLSHQDVCRVCAYQEWARVDPGCPGPATFPTSGCELRTGMNIRRSAKVVRQTYWWGFAGLYNCVSWALVNTLFLVLAKRCALKSLHGSPWCSVEVVIFHDLGVTRASWNPVFIKWVDITLK